MKIKQSIAVLVVSLSTALFATSPSVTWYVDASAPVGGSGLSSASAFPTIAEAIEASASGDTVQIAAGVYRENVVVDGKSLTIVGAGRDATIIDAEESGRPLYLKGAAVTGTRVKSLGLANGRADVGAGLYVDTADVDVGFLDGKIMDCVSTDNGAAANGSAWIVRTLIGRCWAAGSGQAVFTGVNGLFSCVIVGCGRKVTDWDDADVSHILDLYDSGVQIKVVNCTFSSNEGRLTRWDGNQTPVWKLVIKNCAFFGVHSAWVRTGMAAEYSFSSRGGVLTPDKHNIGEDNIRSTTPYQVVAPFLDWRPLVGADIVDCGNNEFITSLVPEEYRETDYYGNPRIQDDTVDMGAAEGSVSPASGIIFFPVALNSTVYQCVTNLWVNGYRVVAADNQQLTGATTSIANGIHFASTDAHCTASMEFRYFDDRSLAVWGVTGMVANVATVWHPNQKGVFTFVLPASGVVSNTLIKAASIKWVSPDGSNSNAGTEAAPYRTLQTAHDSSSSYGVVFAKRGTYAEGSHVGIADSANVRTTLNRLYISKKVYLTSVDGAENTIIRGERSTGEGTYDGCGSGAMRCVQVNNALNACVCGFTLTGGATDASPIAKQIEGKSGNSAARGNFGGSAAQGFTWNKQAAGTEFQLVDCIISNNVSYFGTVYGVIAKNCVFADNRIVNADSSGATVSNARGVMGTVLRAFGCLGTGSFAGFKWFDDGGIAYNSTLVGYSDSNSCTFRNTAFVDPNSTPPSGNGNLRATKRDFADAAHGDWRPGSGSDLLTGGVSLSDDIYVRFGTSSFDGFGDEPGTELGLVVGACRGLAPSRDLYVNAAKADDSGDGLTPATAKKTLAAVMALARRGDVVHAAAGTYDQGEMTNTVSFINTSEQTSDNLIGSRVVIPSGVSLVADGGPAATFIRGRLGSENYGLGVEALRGVYMEEDTLLEGFTVMTCATRSGGGIHEYNCGACVAAPYANVAKPAIIRNCRLTDGRARSGAAAFGGVFERCCIDSCVLTSDGLTYYAKLDNCLVVSTSKVISMSVFRSCYGVRNSTVYVDDVSGDPDFDLADGSFGFENSIVYYEKFTRTTALKNAKNCIVKSATGLTIDSSTCTGITTYAGNLSDLLDTTTYRPVVGSAAINAGDMTLFNANPSALDCGGGQRVYSGTVDIGAYEYSPLDAMGKALAKKDVSVVAADGGATVDVGVLLANGVLEAVWQKKSPSAFCEVLFQVTGNGVLVVADETGVIGRYAVGVEERLKWDPPGTGAKHIYFTYQPAANEPFGAGVEILRMDVVSVFVIIFR